MVSEVWLHEGRCVCGAAYQIERDGRCPACLGLGGLVFLPAGDPALTRRASALSARVVVVLDIRRRRNRHERRGTLLEPAALERARAACAADAVERGEKAAKRRVRDAARDLEFIAAFAAAIRTAYPGCPDAEAIARHACEKHSGRVGRTAAAKAFDAEMVDLAVRAHIRHAHTPYDSLRDEGLDKRTSRARIRAAVEEVAARWRAP